jgi:hypothetical protein
MRNYIRKFPTLQERLDDEAYERRDAIAGKWIPFHKDEGSFCSNFSMRLSVAKDGTISWNKANKDPDIHGPWIHDIMPSAMWLYRLACVFKPVVQFDGPEGYKLVWSAAFCHVKTGVEIQFYEWKGGFTFGARGPKGNVSPEDPVFIEDCLELLNFLASDECPHPYDGVVAGSVA